MIAAGFTHLLRRQPKLKYDFTVQPIAKNFSFVWVKVPIYNGAHDKKRILNWFRFALKLRHLPKSINCHPDTILVSSPSLISFLGAQRLAKKTKAKLVFEVRDIWPLTLLELGGFAPRHPFIRFLQWIEDKAYKESVKVLSNLPNSVDHMVARGMDRRKFTWIPNGFDRSGFYQSSSLRRSVQEALPKGKFIVGYTGTFGLANSLDTLIDAAFLLKEEEDIAFVLVGSGKEKASLVEQAKGLRNVHFIEPIPKCQVQGMLAGFDVCYIGWRAVQIYRFGIAANKLIEYLFSAKPIIHGYSGYRDFVEEAGAGLTVPAENPKALAETILKVKTMSSEERQEMGDNGFAFASEHHDYGKLAHKLAEVLDFNSESDNKQAG